MTQGIRLIFPFFRCIFLLGHSRRISFEMRKKTALFILMFLFFVSTSWPQGLRKATLAGSWYPKEPGALSRLIDHLLQNVKMPSLPSGDILAIIAPHAGYAYSGQVAAYAYKLIQNKSFESVIILSPSQAILKLSFHQSPLQFCYSLLE